MSDLLPLPLRQAIESGQCVLFLGAGVGSSLTGPDGKRAPTGAELAAELAKHFEIDTEGSSDLSKVAKVVEIRHGRAKLDAFLSARFTNLTPSDDLRWLLQLRWRAIFTTNYDRAVERAYELNGSLSQIPIVISASGEMGYWNSQFEIPIIHLHGVVEGTPSRFLITEDDYLAFRERRRMLFEQLKKDMALSTLLYLGYSHNDSNWRLVLEELREDFAPHALPPGYRLARSTDALTREILKNKNLTTLDGDLDEFISAAKVDLRPQCVDPDSLASRREKLSPTIQALFDRNSPAATRFAGSWICLNDVRFDEPPRTLDFVKGDLPEWSLLAKRIPFERDASTSLLDAVLDTITSPVPKADLHALIGPAGVGVTTALLGVAVRLVDDRAGTVFVLKRTAQVLEGDLEFVVRNAPPPVVLFVDNAADHAGALGAAIAHLRDENLSACLVVGERLNEWRLARVKMTSTEHLMEDLSDAEVVRCLAFLETHSSLGNLAHLPPDLRVAAVREKHEKQLLVLMREISESNRFDAIVEDEYRALQEASRWLYGAVAAAFSLRAYLRDDVVAKMRGEALADIFTATRDGTEGVIRWECIDEERQEYAARTRHQKIGEVVWERCLSEADRGAFLQAMVSALNLTYSVDRELFDALIRSDRHVDAIASLDDRIRFFDSACRKSPENAYVLQHYARMLKRAGKLQLARTQIERAIEGSPKVRVLHHTKGTILHSLALEAESTEVARRFLVQSEVAFRTALRLYDRDAYSYQGLAELYLGWAKRSPPGEAAEYLSKAEEVIAEGLGKVHAGEREFLFISASNVEDWIGNRPEALTALEKAVEGSPDAVYSRYLLAKAYLRQGRNAEALAVVEPLLAKHQDEFRAAFVAAEALIALGKGRRAAISVMELTATRGLSDAKFIAMLGGLYFLEGEYEKAERVFGEALKRSFAAEAVRRTRFDIRLLNGGGAAELVGTVASTAANGATLNAAGLPGTIWCPGTRFGRLNLRKGMKVRFDVVFSARGPEATGVRAA